MLTHPFLFVFEIEDFHFFLPQDHPNYPPERIFSSRKCGKTRVIFSAVPKGWRWTREPPGVFGCLTDQWRSGGAFHRSLGVISYSCGARRGAHLCGNFGVLVRQGSLNGTHLGGSNNAKIYIYICGSFEGFPLP